jgi:DNA-binding NarL/FixJ family response regulator
MPPTLRLTTVGDADQVATQVSIRVALADQHGSMRRSLRQLLDAESDIDVVAEARDLPTALERVAMQHPSVLVTDLRLPNGSAIEALKSLRERSSTTEVVVMTMEESPLWALRLLEAGAAGFVLKHRAEAELRHAIRRAARGEEYVSARLVDGVEALRAAGGRGTLGPRDTDILKSIALGYTSAEIARRLRLSRRTVETHRARIYTKLGLTTRAELVQYALRSHLIG